MVLPYHQLKRLLGNVIVEVKSLRCFHVGREHGRVGELYQADDAVVDQADELWAYALVYHCLASGLEVAYAARLYEKLVGERRGSEYAPRRSIIVELLGEKVAALVQCVLKLLVCIVFCHNGIFL